jgi:CheY-like chemotaxis protein
MCGKITEDPVGMEATVPKPAPATPKTILLVDDQDESRAITKWYLGSFGYVVHAFPNAADALTSFNPQVHDLVVTDNRMPGLTGREMAHVIKMRSPATPVLMYSGEAPSDRSGLDAVVCKPAGITALNDAIDKLFKSEPAPPNADSPCPNNA